jgi:3-isopropylmalate/(R)-2-methylmalate dehydratase large subunit
LGNSLGYTAIEKVLGRAASKPGARAGEVVHPIPDLIMIHDGVVQSSKLMLDKIGINRLSNPEKVMMVSDHDVLYGSAKAAERGSFNRKAARDWKVGHFFDVGEGGHGHIFPIEDGRVLPGMFYFDNDTHATNAGAVGAFGMRLGPEITTVLATGTTWIEIPQTIKILLRGLLQPGVQARDVGFYLSRLIKNRVLPIDLDNRVVEYAGDLEQFGLGERVALCSSPTEMRAAGVFVPPSQRILRHSKAQAKISFAPVYSDDDAKFESHHEINISNLQPQIALPGGVGNSVDISEAVGTRVNHAFIGSCGSGMYEDLLTTASMLKGRRISAEVRLFIVPGSQRSMRKLVEDGLMQIFVEAGAMVLPPGCGPCNDAVVGPLASGESSISTATNSNAGRFGARDARLFLGSPLTVAASAVAGQIVDPRSFSADESLTLMKTAAYG